MSRLSTLSRRPLYLLAKHLIKLRNRHYAVLDFLIFLATPALAVLLRTDSVYGPMATLPSLVVYTLVALLLRLLIFHNFGMYQRYWRFVSAFDFVQLLFATLAALCLSTLCFFLLRYLHRTDFILPMSIPIVDALLSLFFTGGIRASVALTESIRATSRTKPQPRTLIFGAGYTGAQLAREIRSNQNIHLQLIGFVDDDPEKRHVQIHNVPILGGRQELPTLIQYHQIERVIIAMPSAPGSAIRDLITVCQKAKVSVQIMPGVHELINGNVSISKLRNVQIEDLLRRAPIETNIGAVSQLLAGKCVLVTGGGGSIGSELCRQILRCRPSTLLLLGHGENSIFEIHQELTRWLNSESISNTQPIATILIPVIVDMRFRNRLFGVLAEHKPEIVFHAAAHKHVPLMETNVVEAVTNNILGTSLLLEAAQANGVERFVMISTDKAVNPTNVMGATKRVAELLVLQAACQGARFYQVVRFGNVLGSRGSVIHTFHQQIADGGPVMVTHPEMVRYFMTIPEAVQLVLQAAVVGHGAEVLMLDMGDPVRIVDLARDLIELSGLRPGHDIEIAFSGLRPGEKLFEEMFKPTETHQRTAHDKIFIASNAGQMLPLSLTDAVEELIEAALGNDSSAVVQLLCRLLPEYQPWPSHIIHADRANLIAASTSNNPTFAATIPPAISTSHKLHSLVGD